MKVLLLGNKFADLPEWLTETGESVVTTENRVGLQQVREIGPEFIVSYNYRYLLPKQVIDWVGGRAVNLHISYLPYNRGTFPNVWSFLEDTPTGVTIHYMDESIDTGDIIVQKVVYIDESKETLRSSYEILHREIQGLFKAEWEKIKRNEIVPKAQNGQGSFHYYKEFDEKIEGLIKDKGWNTPVSEIKGRYREIFGKRHEKGCR